MGTWDDDGDWVEVSECAQRMAISPDRVHDLVRQRALRTRHDYGRLLVQPAIVSGAVQ